VTTPPVTQHPTIVSYPTRDHESQEAVIQLLQEISLKLQTLLPDPALSPLERVERLARVIPESIQHSAQHLTARQKMTHLRLRLAELVPDPDLDEHGKIDALVAKVHTLVPGQASRLFEKLEKMGDCRMVDNGSIPFEGWTLAHRYWPHLKGGCHGTHS